MRKGVSMYIPMPQRFWSQVEGFDDEECWNWKGRILPNGYGQFWLEGKKVYAHRFAYELVKGLIPEGLTVDHLCRNRKCVNPNHLEAVTMKVNFFRGSGSLSPFRLPVVDGRITKTIARDIIESIRI